MNEKLDVLPIEGVDFRYRPDLSPVVESEEEIDGSTVPIEVLTGKFKGMFFRLSKVGIEETENMEGVLRFSYSIDEKSENRIGAGDNSEIRTLIGDILVSILEDFKEAYEEEKGINGNPEDSSEVSDI